MAKLQTGEKMPDFTYDTPFAAGVALSDTARRVTGRTALVFLRYYGCTLCQYDIHRYAKEYGQIAATGGQMLVVLQSDPKKLAGQLKPGDLPFDIVCDPEARLYQQLDIRPAASQAGLADAGTMLKIAKAKAGGVRDGAGSDPDPCALRQERGRRARHKGAGRTAAVSKTVIFSYSLLNNTRPPRGGSTAAALRGPCACWGENA